MLSVSDIQLLTQLYYVCLMAIIESSIAFGKAPQGERKIEFPKTFRYH